MFQRSFTCPRLRPAVGRKLPGRPGFASPGPSSGQGRRLPVRFSPGPCPPRTAGSSRRRTRRADSTVWASIAPCQAEGPQVPGDVCRRRGDRPIPYACSTRRFREAGRRVALVLIGTHGRRGISPGSSGSIGPSRSVRIAPAPCWSVKGPSANAARPHPVRYGLDRVSPADPFCRKPLLCPGAGDPGTCAASHLHCPFCTSCRVSVVAYAYVHNRLPPIFAVLSVPSLYLARHWRAAQSNAHSACTLRRQSRRRSRHCVPREVTGSPTPSVNLQRPHGRASIPRTGRRARRLGLPRQVTSKRGGAGQRRSVLFEIDPAPTSRLKARRGHLQPRRPGSNG